MGYHVRLVQVMPVRVSPFPILPHRLTQGYNVSLPYVMPMRGKRNTYILFIPYYSDKRTQNTRSVNYTFVISFTTQLDSSFRCICVNMDPPHHFPAVCGPPRLFDWNAARITRKATTCCSLAYYASSMHGMLAQRGSDQHRYTTSLQALRKRMWK